ncbi:MAG: ParA family protein, partial [Prevotella sp.]
MKQAKVIAVANHKGGVGKTTTVASVGTILARNHKVLLVDLDPQMNLTLSLVRNTNRESIYDSLVGKQDELPVMSAGTIDLVPSSLELSKAEFEMVSMMAREQRLTHLLEPLRKKYDYIFLDCPPSLGILTFNALTAADSVIIPLVPELLPLQGLGTIDSLVRKMKAALNSKLTITGILLTRTEQTKIH